MYTVKATDPKWLKNAFAELGEREISGKKNNPRIVEYFGAIGHKEIKNDETAWCAAFVGFCLEKAGIKSTMSAAARSYLRWGKSVKSNLARGSIAVFKRGTEAWQGHVGIVLDDNPTHIWVLGGNQGNSVSVKSFRRDTLIDARWPETASNSRTIKAMGGAAALQVTGALMETVSDAQGVVDTMGSWWDYAMYGSVGLGIAMTCLAGYYRYVAIKERGK